MDSSLQQPIISVVTFAIVTVVAAIQAKQKSEMFSLREMIKKSLLLKEFSSATPSSDPEATPKAYPGANSLSKTITKRRNQANLGYFDFHLNRAYGEGEIVLVGKDVYYRDAMLFIQRFQSFVSFQGAAFVKANIATSLQGFALESYTPELSDFDRNALNNNSGVKR